MRLLLIPLLLFLHATAQQLPALSSDALTVLRVIDGDSIIVSGQCAGVELPIAVRLQYIDAPEMRDGDKENLHGVNAKQHLQKLLKKGDRVHLWTSQKSFQADGHGRVLALVYSVKDKTCIQEYMIKSGYSVYWQRFGQVDKRLHPEWEQLEAHARDRRNGLWSADPTWMQDKTAED